MTPYQPEATDRLTTLSHKLSALTRYTLYAILIFSPLPLASVPDWAVTTIHLLTLIALTAFLVEKCLTWNWQWIRTPLDLPILALITLAILSTMFSVYRYASVWSVILLLNYIVIYYLVIHTVRTRDQFKQLIYVIIAVAVFLAILGLMKLAGASPFSWWEYKDARQFRLESTFYNPDHMAGYMEMAIPFMLGLFLYGYRGARLVLMIFLALILFLAIFLTLSRGGWLGLGVGLGFMALVLLFNRRREKKLILLASICGVFILAFIVLSQTSVVERIRTFERLQHQEESPIGARILRWKGTVKMIKDHPWFGSGPGTYATVFTQYQPPGFGARSYYAHNDYLHFTAEVGVFLLAIVLWMMVALYRKAFEKLKSPSRLVSGTAIGVMAGITAILVHSFGDFNLNIPANAILFAVLAALAAGPVPLDNVSRIRLNPAMMDSPFFTPNQK